MDYSKIGQLIYNLRKENNMTQKELAEKMNLSDRTISKWERGVGCPDVSLLHKLSHIFKVSIENILSGDLAANEQSRGSMKKIKFYVCPCCGNILVSTEDADIACCGRKLASLDARPEDQSHTMLVEEVDGEYFVSIRHEMSKTHFISFLAYAACGHVTLVKLYPEQAAEVRFPKFYGGQLYGYCIQHGLWQKRI